MESLSEFVDCFLVRGANKRIDIVSELDQNLPKIYEHDKDELLRSALIRLGFWNEEAYPKKILYHTSQDNGMQLLKILRDGYRVPKEELESLNNNKMQDITSKLKGYNARITFENLPEGHEYTVRTIVKTPIPA